VHVRHGAVSRIWTIPLSRERAKAEVRAANGLVGAVRNLGSRWVQVASHRRPALVVLQCRAGVGLLVLRHPRSTRQGDSMTRRIIRTPSRQDRGGDSCGRKEALTVLRYAAEVVDYWSKDRASFIVPLRALPGMARNQGGRDGGLSRYAYCPGSRRDRGGDRRLPNALGEKRKAKDTRRATEAQGGIFGDSTTVE